MDILHIISGDGGGISTYVKSLIKENNQNIKFTVLSFGDFNEEFLVLQDTGKVKLFNMPRPKIDGFSVFFKYLWNFFRNNNFTFIECHIPGLQAVIFKLISMINNSHFFAIHSHQSVLVFGESLSLTEKIVDLLNPKINRSVSNLFLACGEEASYYAFRKKEDSKIRIINNAIDTRYFYKYYVNKKVKNNVVDIGHIGRHTKAKNFEFIIGLASYLKKHHESNSYRIHLVGDGELTEQIKKDIKDYNLKNIIIVHGRQSNVGELIKEFDVTILPSYSEGFGTVAIESQATGTPIICSENVSKEVDLGVGLVKYLETKNTDFVFESWKETIDLLVEIETPSIEQINNAIENKYLDNKGMYNKYLKIIQELS